MSSTEDPSSLPATEGATVAPRAEDASGTALPASTSHARSEEPFRATHHSEEAAHLLRYQAHRERHAVVQCGAPWPQADGAQPRRIPELVESTSSIIVCHHPEALHQSLRFARRESPRVYYRQRRRCTASAVAFASNRSQRTTSKPPLPEVIAEVAEYMHQEEDKPHWYRSD
ncbi:uncharacterized protein SCHCODRAFT_02481293 [Schizophyllum commune H4-8]|nr:uncharacterized protein SCHCODRAFT_02481293 [Schizophyllum commune H4-8]KAI5899387.1 hypothetical protein SCHCODRAFT_02481293 [Schizophyllum commune H4-8]